VGRDPDFLAWAEAFGIAFMPLAYRYVLAKEDLGMSHFHAAQHIIPALNKNPAGRNGAPAGGSTTFPRKVPSAAKAQEAPSSITNARPSTQHFISILMPSFRAVWAAQS
jgi:hypothetical protein